MAGVLLLDDICRQNFAYDPITGIVTWARDGKQVYVGKPVGRHDKDGYLIVGLRVGCKSTTIALHRLAWFLHTGQWPEGQIDHDNGVKDDNRFLNLRDATPSQNQWNKGRSRANSSGFKGVVFCKQTGRWRAGAKIAGKMVWFGRYDSPEQAHAVYADFVRQNRGEFGRAA